MIYQSEDNATHEASIVCVFSEVVAAACLLFSSSPAHVFLCFMCVSCPSSSIQTSIYHYNSCPQGASPMYSPEHCRLLAGALSCLQPTLDHKGPGRTTSPPSKQPPPHLLCLSAILTERRQESCWVYALWFCQGRKRRGSVLCTKQQVTASTDRKRKDKLFCI